MSAATYVLPQVLVFEEFAAQPAAIAQPQRACIVGPQYDLHRYDEPTEKTGILVGTYDFTTETCYPWPSRAPGGVVDQTYTRIVFENALLKYFHDPAGDGSIVHAATPSKNRVRAASKIFVTANGFVRDAALLRDVAIGDVCKLLASACGSPITFQANVIGFIADQIASLVDPATADLSNQSALSASTSHAQSGGIHNQIDVTSVDGSLYDGLPAGHPAETYVVEVIGGSSAGDATTALLKVTSASGTDDQAAITPAAFNSATSVGTRGLKATFSNHIGSSSSGAGAHPQDDFLIGQKWTLVVHQLYTPPVPGSGGTYGGGADTTYVVTVTRGGKFSSVTKPQISVSTTTGIDISGPTTVPASASAVPIGTQGVTIEFTGAGLSKGDRFNVPVVAARDGAIRTLVLDRNLPDGFRGECITGSSSSAIPDPDLDLTLYIKKTMDVTEDRIGFAPLVNWTENETQVCLESDIIGYDASWASGGVLVALPVEAGTIYVQHRDLVPAAAQSVGTISDVSALPTSGLGTVHPDNPLAFGVFKALENSGGVEVKYLGVNSTALKDWLLALETLVGRDDVYGLVPLSQNIDVLQAFKAHCDAESLPANGRWRIAFLNMAAQPVIPIYATSAIGSGHPVLATVLDDPDTAGTQYTIVESPGEEFITKGVLAGDTVRLNYSSDGFGNFTYQEFTVDALLNEETLRLVSGPTAAINVPSKIEVWRTLSKNNLAAKLAENPGLFADRRDALVWPDTAGNAGLTFPGYFLCAGLAGLRSGVLPHQGLTNVQITGFDDLSRTIDFFSANQLNTLAGSGYWIVTQDPNDGTVFTRHQLTTGDQTDVNQREQSVTTNIDNIAFNFLQTMKPFIGRGNVTPTMISILKGAITSLIEQFKNTIVNDQLGPQIISAQILSLQQDAVLKDRIDCKISLTLPAPFNNLELHLIAS